MSSSHIKEIKLDANYSDTGEWTKTYTDVAGRTVKTIYPDGTYRQSFYNSDGQLWKERDEDGVWTRYQYDGQGRPQYTVMPLSPPPDTYQVLQSSDFGSSDRIAKTEYAITVNGGYNVEQTTTYAWTTSGQDVRIPVAQTTTSKNASNRTMTWQTVWRDANTPVTTTTEAVFDRPNHQRTVTVTAPDQTKTVSVYQYGRLTSITEQATTGATLTRTAYAYDAYGRVQSVTDLRNGATTYAYNEADQVTSTTTPVPAAGQNAQTTTMEYDNMG